MAAPKVEAYADKTPMLLCTACAKLVSVVVTVEDRRGGASLCEECLAEAWDAIQAHLGTEAGAPESGVIELG